jgi:hypothetical protein
LKTIIFILTITAITYLAAGFYYELYSIYDVFNKLKSLDYKVIISGNLYEQIAIVALSILLLIIFIFTFKILIRKKPKNELTKSIQPNLNFVFNSSDHIRYENGKVVSGPFGGAPRAIKVEPNIHGKEGHTVTMFNTDGQYVVQMSPKQMKIIKQNTDNVILCGYGEDLMGESFADYGLTINFLNGKVVKCVLHLHDRSVDIEYLP